MLRNHRSYGVIRTFIVYFLTFLMTFATFPAQAIAEIIDDEPVFVVSDDEADEADNDELPPFVGDEEEVNIEEETISSEIEDTDSAIEEPLAEDVYTVSVDDAVEEIAPNASSGQASAIVASGTWGTCPWELTDDGTLTVHPGIGGNQSGSSSSPWRNYKDSIIRIVFAEENGEKVVSRNLMNYLFYELHSLETVDARGLDTSSVTSMAYAFYGCSSLTSVELDGWDTSSVKSMFYMFRGCSSLSSLNVSGWVVSSASDLHGMFTDCSSLVSLDLSSWNTSNVTKMDSMFSGCSSLVSLDLSTWNTSSVTDMGGMFSRCSSLTSLDLSSWDTSRVTNMDYMFNKCSSLQEILVSHLWSTENVSGSSYSGYWGVFAGCTSLVGGLGTVFDPNQTSPTYARVDTVAAPGYLTCRGAVYSGLWGSCPWDISADGTLTIHPGVGAEQTYPTEMDDVLESPWAQYRDYILSVVFSSDGGGMVVAPNGAQGLFAGLIKLKDIDFAGLDTSMVTDMTAMFSGCASLISLDLSGLDVSNVAKTVFLFSGCSELTSILFSGWNTSNVTDMYGMFNYCSKLSSIDLSAWNTSNVRDISSLFYGCSSLSTANLSGWNTSNVTAMWGVFDGCSSLASINLSRWDTKNVENMSRMFNGCSSLRSLNLSGWNTSNVTSMSEMFCGCSSLVSLNLSNWNTSIVTSMYGLFDGCTKLSSVSVANWDTSSVNDMSCMFSDCASLASLDLSRWNTSNVSSMASMFEGCSSLRLLNLTGWNTSNVTDMSLMFCNCSSLSDLDLDSFDTSSVMTMESMFCGCSSLSGLFLYSFDTSNVTSMRCMFYGCSHLTGVFTFSKTWDTSNVVDMSYMFADCTNLYYVSEFSNFDTSSVTNMERMFANTLFTELDLSGWDTSSVTNMSEMFKECPLLTTLNLYGWNLSSLNYMDEMFSLCVSLRTIYVGLEWEIHYPASYNSTLMFGGCNSLVGENGTRYTIKISEANRDWLYAHIDTSDNPGLLSLGPFSDVNTRTGHYEDIVWLYGTGVTKGWVMSDGTIQFRPFNNVARADMAAFLCRLVNGKDYQYEPTDEDVAYFSDVNWNTSHCREIWWLAHEGISRGWTNSDGSHSFKPYANVARCDMACFLMRMALGPDAESTYVPDPSFEYYFSDVSYSTAHRSAVLWLASMGISKGWDMGGGRYEFRPYNNVARADMAAFLHRMDDAGLVPQIQ